MRVEPVVKADAYGHGAIAVASWLERVGADGLCVATLDEGLALRAAGIVLPILVLYPIPPDGARAAAAGDLAVTVGERVILARMLRALADADRQAAPLAVHVEVETGLGRGGIDPADVPAVVAEIAADPAVRFAGAWSHLAAPADLERSSGQATRFAAAIAALGSTAAVRHLASTGGVLAGSAPPHDSVRLGLGLYGLLPDGWPPSTGGPLVDGPLATLAGALRPVLSLHARPVRVADLPAGHGVSYGPTLETSRPSRIATLPLGYADGWPRSLSDRAEALVRGRRVPLVGAVAMDAVMADVTDVPGRPVGIDDEFVLLGAQAGALGSDEIAAAELARLRTTIVWEVVSVMARRLPRVYHAAAVPVGVTTLTEEIRLWSLGSSSGTGISVTSRSTRS